MEINKLLDDCMAKLEVKTDYALAKKLGMHTAEVSLYRNGGRVPDEYACFVIADTLDIDKAALIANFKLIKERNPERRKYWEKKLADLGGLAASIFVVVNLIMTPTPSQAAPVLDHEGGVCILC